MADILSLAPGEKDIAKIVAVVNELVRRVMPSEDAAAGALQAANNLSDVASASAARGNLGLGALAVKSTIATGDIDNDAVSYAKLQNTSAQSRILGRKSSGAGDTEECTLSEVLDFIGSAVQGDVLYRGASAWARLGAGTSGHFLKTNGAGADPAWAAVSGMTLVGSASASSGTTASITGIPACKMLVTAYRNISHNNGANQTLRFALSTNNGSSYGTPQNMFSTALAAAVSGSGILKIARMDQTSGFIFEASFVAQILGGVETGSSGTVNAIQFSWSAGSFDDASGAFYVYALA